MKIFPTGPEDGIVDRIIDVLSGLIVIGIVAFVVSAPIIAAALLVWGPPR